VLPNRKTRQSSIAGSLKDVYPKKLEAPRLELRRERAEALLGVPLGTRLSSLLSNGWTSGYREAGKEPGR